MYAGRKPYFFVLLTQSAISSRAGYRLRLEGSYLADAGGGEYQGKPRRKTR